MFVPNVFERLSFTYIVAYCFYSNFTYQSISFDFISMFDSKIVDSNIQISQKLKLSVIKFEVLFNFEKFSIPKLFRLFKVSWMVDGNVITAF